MNSYSLVKSKYGLLLLLGIALEIAETILDAESVVYGDSLTRNVSITIKVILILMTAVAIGSSIYIYLSRKNESYRTDPQCD